MLIDMIPFLGLCIRLAAFDTAFCYVMHRKFRYIYVFYITLILLTIDLYCHYNNFFNSEAT